MLFGFHLVNIHITFFISFTMMFTDLGRTNGIESVLNCYVYTLSMHFFVFFFVLCIWFSNVIDVLFCSVKWNVTQSMVEIALYFTCMSLKVTHVLKYTICPCMRQLSINMYPSRWDVELQSSHTRVTINHNCQDTHDIYPTYPDMLPASTRYNFSLIYDTTDTRWPL